ncbi:hypothetical protein LR48_Vigan06g023100 [Vigna angularis]|uniref:Uncharacterized protein n=1 Tax=Phaseolus angularis TaxID=3914 RepID=A0A0L9UPV1_PHAAN|nr:hypothetical protein LR48_Vigan06g023100 [Vigna angularis]
MIDQRREDSGHLEERVDRPERLLQVNEPSECIMFPESIGQSKKSIAKKDEQPSDPKHFGAYRGAERHPHDSTRNQTCARSRLTLNHGLVVTSSLATPSDQVTSSLAPSMTSSLAVPGGQVTSSLAYSSDQLTSNPGRPCIQSWSSSDQLKPLLPRLNYKKLNPFAPANSCSRLGGLNVLYKIRRQETEQRRSIKDVRTVYRPSGGKCQ